MPTRARKRPIITSPQIPSTALAPSRPAAAPAAVSQDELAALIEAFNDATARLSTTHESLQAELTKLRAQLADAKVQVERTKHLALLGEMAAGIAHEVRNPLGSILLYARMLQHDLADRPPQKSTADKIATSVQRLEAVVGDVLSFSRQNTVRYQAINAHELLESALHAAQADSPLWHSIVSRIDAPQRLTINADPHALTQALINLIRNGADAMADNPPGRPRHLTLQAATATARDPDGTHVHMHALRIHDTGPGIDDSTAEKLFTPFFTTRATGTGLGLAIVHRVIDAHKGRVSLRSRQEPTSRGAASGTIQGATAEILLPAATSEISTTLPPETAQQPPMRSGPQ